MKITKSQLKQIILEELQLLSEEEYDRYRDDELVKYGYRGKGDYERRQAAAIRKKFSSALSDEPREEPRYNLPQYALEPGERWMLNSQIKKLKAQYGRTDDQKEKEEILNQIEDLKTQRDAPFKEE